MIINGFCRQEYSRMLPFEFAVGGVAVAQMNVSLEGAIG